MHQGQSRQTRSSCIISVENNTQGCDPPCEAALPQVQRFLRDREFPRAHPSRETLFSASQWSACEFSHVTARCNERYAPWIAARRLLSILVTVIARTINHPRPRFSICIPDASLRGNARASVPRARNAIVPIMQISLAPVGSVPAILF